MRVKATMIPSSSTESTVDLGSFEPIGRSPGEVRSFRLGRVFWSIPSQFGQRPQALLAILYYSTRGRRRRGATHGELEP
ncbi:hypothetical protein CR492_15390 [Methylocella silvestris]|uniref:Uncharacterized protein n=1 Tax=Methylocella silvestris TaxID=199596 RepID=A0A2J7TE56_METSI|nr:hypothetical protein CR492_15390 [Methylocella silvestris]